MAHPAVMASHNLVWVNARNPIPTTTKAEDHQATRPKVVATRRRVLPVVLPADNQDTRRKVRLKATVNSQVTVNSRATANSQATVNSRPMADHPDP
jgi:hypothetical protein